MQAEGRDPGHSAGNGGLTPRDPAQLRISDDDRHRVAEVLRTAAGEGRIDLEELDERLEATFRAKTYAELVPITSDLPAGTGPRPQAPVPAPASHPATPAGPSYASSVAVMSETRRTGPWQVADQHGAFALMGSVVLDLREARFAAHEVVVNASAIMGEVKILVNATTHVLVEGVGIMGEFKEQRAKVPPEVSHDSPVVRVRGFALMGSVTVQRRGPSLGGLRGHLGLSGG